MSSLDLSQDTIRQRRNLVVVSTLLIFISLADVSFGDTVKFLGATLSIGKPEIIHQGLIVLLAYFLWRFYQYFTTDNAYNELCSQFKNHMQSTTSIKIVQAICKPRGLNGLTGEYRYGDLKYDGNFTYCIEASETNTYNTNSGAVESNAFQANISVIKLEISRLFAAFSFMFKARILTDYFVPYVLAAYAVYLQFV